MNRWSLSWIRESVRGTWLARASEPGREATGVSIDTRTLKPGDAFFAIVGDRHDGHDHVAKAVERGASAVIVERAVEPFAEGPGLIRVDSTRAALGRMAAAHRGSLERTKVIGVTGSNGKTTAVRMIHAALSAGLRGTHAPGSFNNNIGLPLTLLAAQRSDDFVVCELGMNAPGEIASLASLARPDIAVITSIGRAHLERLGSIEAIAHEKASIFSALVPRGLAVVPGGTPVLAQAMKVYAGINAIRVGTEEDAEVRIVRISSTETGLELELNGSRVFAVPMVGDHNAINAAMAVCVAQRLGLADEDIRAGLVRTSPPPMRLARREVRGRHLLVDCYNANPDSMRAAISVFLASPADGRRVLVLGEMLELGAASPDLHREIVEVGTADPRASRLVLLGKAWAEADLPDDPRLSVLPVIDDAAIDEVVGMLKPGDRALIKGSRGCELERIVARIEAGSTDDAPSPAING